MAKLMHYYGQEVLTSCIAEIIGIIDAASTVMLSVHKDDDMFVRCASQHIVEALQVERGEVTVAVECVEVRAQSRMLPDSLGRFTGA